MFDSYHNAPLEQFQENVSMYRRLICTHISTKHIPNHFNQEQEPNWQETSHHTIKSESNQFVRKRKTRANGSNRKVVEARAVDERNKTTARLQLPSYFPFIQCLNPNRSVLINAFPFLRRKYLCLLRPFPLVQSDVSKLLDSEEQYNHFAELDQG